MGNDFSGVDWSSQSSMRVPESAAPSPGMSVCSASSAPKWRAWGSASTWRRIRCAEGPWSWVTSHTFRKTVATRLDEAGLTPRQVADQLGHANPSMTLDVYFGRQVVSAEVALVLDR